MDDYYLYVKTKPKYKKVSFNELKLIPLLEQFASMENSSSLEKLKFIDKMFDELIMCKNNKKELSDLGFENIEAIKKDYSDMGCFYLVNLDNYEDSYAYFPGSNLYSCPLTEDFVNNSLKDLKRFINDAMHIYKYATVTSKISSISEDIIILYKLDDLFLAIKNGEFILFPDNKEKIQIEYGKSYEELLGMDTINNCIIDRIKETPFDFDDNEKKLIL